MAKAVLTTKISSDYDDLPEIRYHFPKQYLSRVSQALDDFIIYYEPRRSNGELASRGGRQSYFATARLSRIEKDPKSNNLFYAFVDDYLEFERTVPFKEGELFYENSLKKEDGSVNKGAFRNAVRIISEKEYNLILQSGFHNTLENSDEKKVSTKINNFGVVQEEIVDFKRSIAKQIVARPFRDAAFSKAIKSVYDNKCAMTGIKIINGGGHSEVQAAHIQPVSQDGPDSLRNGIALSGTAHWMFDRGLVSIDDDYSILIVEKLLPDAALRLLNRDLKLILPDIDQAKPHSTYLRYHRNNIFKG